MGRALKSQGFAALLAAETTSMVGTQVTSLAVPYIAAVTLGLGSLEMGLLEAARTVPIVLLGLPFGALVDRIDHRRTLMRTNVVRAFALGFIPLMYGIGLLDFVALCVLMLVVGSCGVLFDITIQSYVPRLVGPAALADANSKMELGRSVADIAGPGVAGYLISALTAPIAVIVDSLSYLAAALLMALGTRPLVTESTRGCSDSRILKDILAGLQFVWSHKRLRWLILAAAVFNVLSGAADGQLVLFMTRTLNMSGATVGLAFSCGAVAAILSAIVTPWLSRVFGLMGSIGVGGLLACVGTLMAAAAAVDTVVGLVVVSVGIGLMGAGSTIFAISAVTYRQTVTPPEILGRVNATARTAIMATIPFGALLGGVTAELTGTRILVGAAGLLMGLPFTLLWLFTGRHGDGRATIE